MKNTFFSRTRGLLLLSLCGFFSASINAAPTLKSAYIENVQVNTADVYVSASAGTDRFKCRMNRDGLVNHDFWVTADENGKFTLEGMRQCTVHTLEIWAVDEDVTDSISENSITLTYSTLGDGIDLYVRGQMNSWGTTWQFRYTPVTDIYAVTAKMSSGSFQYQIANSGWSSKSDYRYLNSPEDKYVTVYARSIINFASSADSIYIAGTAVNPEMDETSAWKLSNAALCTWVGTQAIWKGAINRSGKYKFIKHTYKEDIWSADLYNDNQSIPSTFTASFAKFTFDLPTLSWKWEELDDLCTTTGTDYSLSLYLNADSTALQVSATSTKSTVPTAAAFYCYDYTSADNDYTAALKTLVTDGTTYIASIPLTALPKSTDNKICYNVVFTYSDNSTLTTDTLFYSLAGGCTTDTLHLCHHGQSEGDYTTTAFSGTRIVQPIVYRRKFAPGYWETLCLPFEVTKMWVYDTDDKKDYDLYPQYISGNDTTSGEYWLRTFSDGNIEAASADKSWQTAASAANYLPKKNTPYIIMFPEDESGYYKDKYVYFAASGFQTIASAFSPLRPTLDDTYSYIGNTTLQPQNVTNAYLLASGNEYFDASTDGTGTLYPFECALFATEKTVACAPRLRINRRQDTPTGILPTTAAAAGEVYTLWGNRVGAFASWDDYDALVRHLPAGLYIIRSGSTSRKICLTK